MILIGDPCYVLPDDATFRDDTARDWGRFVDATFASEGPRGVYTPFGRGVAVGISTGVDGTFPVYLEQHDNGRRLIIELP